MQTDTKVTTDKHLWNGSYILADVGKLVTRILLKEAKRLRGIGTTYSFWHFRWRFLLFYPVQTENPMTISLVLQVFAECLLCAKLYARL